MSPDGSSKPLPEEKLLRLIRGKGSKRDAAPQGAATVAAALPRSWRPAPPVRWVPVTIMGLIAILVVEVVALGVQVIRPAPLIALPTMPAPAEGPPAEAPPLPPMPSLAQSAPPELFGVPAGSAGTNAEPGERVRTGPSQMAQQLASRLTLMGIMAGDPAQAIIEDATTKKSLFVSVGQPVIEGAVLDQVLDNRVILDLNGEKVELGL